MSDPVVTREAVLAAACRALRPGVSNEQAVLVGYSEVVGTPLDPFGFDDAAILLRAEALLLEGLPVAEAVTAARAECPTWNLEGAA